MFPPELPAPLFSGTIPQTTADGISPLRSPEDGRFVASTVRDQSVFMARPDTAFSQLFSPVKGIIVVYDRQLKKYMPLSGASDTSYVQSNPVWSPDGTTLLFIRSAAVALERPSGGLILGLNEVGPLKTTRKRSACSG